MKNHIKDYISLSNLIANNFDSPAFSSSISMTYTPYMNAGVSSIKVIHDLK